MTFSIRGLGTALPKYSISTDEMLIYAPACINSTEEEHLRKLHIFFKRSGVKRRHSVLLEMPDGVPPRQTFFVPPNGNGNLHGPTVQDRMERYERDSLPLAAEACQRALEDSGVEPGEITHLVTVSCSGFVAPGVDVGLIKHFNLRPTTERVHVGFMGCHAAVNGLRVARGLAESQPSARVLMCAVELCSLHYAYGWDPGRVLANALFADGAAAVVGGGGGPDRTWRVRATGSCLIPDSEGAMGWRIENHGFAMLLAPEVPDLIRTHLRPWLEPWLKANGFRLDDIPSWAVHPGGPKILDSVVDALNLPPEAVDVSREVLSRCGNMSSPTTLFIVEQLRLQNAPLPCVAMAFGPGLMAEAVLFV